MFPRHELRADTTRSCPRTTSFRVPWQTMLGRETEAKCCDKDAGLESWKFLKTRLADVRRGNEIQTFLLFVQVQ